LLAKNATKSVISHIKHFSYIVRAINSLIFHHRNFEKLFCNSSLVLERKKKKNVNCGPVSNRNRQQGASHFSSQFLNHYNIEDKDG